MKELKRGRSTSDEWEKFLASLDEKMQLGLLEHVRAAHSAILDEAQGFLTISPATDESYNYLAKDSVRTQCELLAQDVIPSVRCLIIAAPISPD